MSTKKKRWGLRASLTALVTSVAAIGLINASNDNINAASDALLSRFTFDFNKNAAKATMSGETRDLLGNEWANRITDWSGMDILVLSSRDFQHANLDLKGKTHTERNAVKAQYVRDRYPQVDMSRVDDEMLATLFDLAKAGEPVSFNFSTQGTEKLNQCIVTMPGEDWSKEFYFAALAGIDKIDVENVPGTKVTWQTMVMIHEAWHCRPNHEKDIRNPELNRGQRMAALTLEEVGADQYTAYVVKNLLKQGHDEFEGMNEAFMYARAIGTFNRWIEPHISSGVLNIIDPTQELQHSAEEIVNGALVALVQIYGEVGAQYVDELDRAYVMLKYMEAKGERYTPAFENLLDALRVEDRESINAQLDGMKTADPERWEEYQIQFALYQIEMGLKKCKDDPENFYTIAQKQIAEGLYDDYPLSLQYVTRAMTAYERYAPGLIGLKDNDNNVYKLTKFEYSSRVNKTQKSLVP